MVMTVKGRATVRFERRWLDYCRVLEEGTSPLVGKVDPRPADRRKEVETAFQKGCEAADAELAKAWAIDARAWRERLSDPFLKGFSPRELNAFMGLVKAGCQPDILALHFHEATQVKEYAKDHDHILVELGELERLTTQAVSALRQLANRRKQFDEYLHDRGLRVVYGEPGDAELKILFADLEDLAGEHQRDYRGLRRQLDGRRQPLLGHAEIRLSRRIHEVTTTYHDRDVEDILNGLRERRGQKGRLSGTLKRRRARWAKELRSGHRMGGKKRGKTNKT